MKRVQVLHRATPLEEHYLGLTLDGEKRVKAYSGGKVPGTSKYLPRRLVVTVGFEDDQRAGAFECCLESGSGRALARRHLWWKTAWTRGQAEC